MFKSSLFNENTFYRQFVDDLLSAKEEIIIESPFITSERIFRLRGVFEKIIQKGVKVYVVTRDPREHVLTYEVQSEAAIQEFEELGVQVFLCAGNHHRKLAIIDREILWEGSLNILSHIKSREIMRRIESQQMAQEMFDFLKLAKYIN